MPVPAPEGAKRIAVAYSLGAAFLWAAYYPLVLGVHPATPPSGLLALPFLVGGIVFAGAAGATGAGRSFRALWRDATAWGRGLLLATMQILILESTYLSGAVDTALLSLVGDVVVTPILLAVLFHEGGARARSAVFVGGVAACLGGAALTILVGGSARPLSGIAIPVAVSVPFLIALYFLAMARANRTAPMTAVAGQATLVAGFAGLGMAPFLPGGIGGLLPPSAPAALVVVGIGATTFFIAPAFYFRAIGRAGILLPSVLMASIPLFTLLFAATVLGAVPPPLALAGIPIATAGAVAALRGEHPPDPRAPPRAQG